MGKLGREDVTKLRELAAELDVLRLDADAQVPALLPAMRALLEADSLLVLCPVQRASGWDIERFDSDNFPRGKEFERRFVRFFATAPSRFAWYDATRPEPDQRNRVIDALDIIPTGELEQSRIYHEVIHPAGLHHDRQPRVLLCDGPSLLAWFGAFHARPFDARQNALLGGLITPMRRRLRVERRLQYAPRARAMLEVALDRLGAPAFITDAHGRVCEANAAGRALLQTRRRELALELRDAVAGTRADPRGVLIELTPIVDRGMPRSWLAVLRAGSRDAQLATATAAAAARWGLTRRQRDVLELVVRGEPTTTIAAALRITERAVEQHLTAMFDRVGCDSRAGLVAAVLAG